MGLPAGASQTQPRSSLIDDSGRINERLRDVLSRLTTVANKLHGAAPPRDVSNRGGPDREATVRGNVDSAHNLLSDADAELARLEGAL